MIDAFNIARDDTMGACVVALEGYITETYDYSTKEILAAIDALREYLDAREAPRVVLDLTRLELGRGDAIESLIVRFAQFIAKRYPPGAIHTLKDRLMVVASDEYIRKRCANLRGMFMLFNSMEEVRDRFAGP